MASNGHMATAEDDLRHQPGDKALPLWSESYWFPIYDPTKDIGIVVRIGRYPVQGTANVYLFITRGGHIIHSKYDLMAALPPEVPDRLEVGGLTIAIEKPLERFRLTYEDGAHGFDLVWTAVSPAYKYPEAPGTTADEQPRHIEQGGHVAGTVRIAGTEYAIDAHGHRDHTWGGERDWDKFYRWDYLSGEFGSEFWFNAVRIRFGPDFPEIRIGCLWDGSRLMDLKTIEMTIRTAEGGTRQTGVDLRIADEAGRIHEITGEQVLANCPVQIRKAWLKDGITRYRMGEKIGYGIFEHGFIEDGHDASGNDV